VSIDGVSALGVDGEALKRLSDLFGLDQADELAACDTVGHKSTHVTETVYWHVIVPASRHYSATGSYGHYREWRVRRNEAFIRPMPVMPR